MTRQKYLLAWVLAAGLSLAASPARASSISFAGVTNGSVIVLDGSLYAGMAWAGELNWEFNDSAPAGFDRAFYAYCVDLTRSLEFTQETTVGSSAGLTGGLYVADAGARAAWLVNNFASAVHTSGLGFRAAALQIAIWEALYDTDLNLGAGRVALAMNDAVFNQADAYLGALGSASLAGSSARVLFASNGQHQIVNSVPEPSTMVLLAIGGILMFWMAGRRRLTERR